MVEKLKAHLDRYDVSIIQWLVAFSCILLVRFFIESLSSPTSSGIIASDAPTLIHYYLFFMSVALALMLFFRWVIPSWRKVIPLLSLFVLTIVIIPPIIDWLVSFGKGFPMSYLIQTPSGLAHSFLTFFGTSFFSGITIGIRVEIAVLILGSAWLVYSIRRSVGRAIVTAISVYVILFIAVSLPGLIFNFFGNPNQALQSLIIHAITLTDNIHGTLRFETLTRLLEIGFDFLMARIWFLILIILSSFWFLGDFKIQFKAILKNSRPERVVHYFFLVLFGTVVAFKQSHFYLNGYDVLTLMTILLAFYFSWMSAVCMNDIIDLGIDQISNSSRPLPSKHIFLNEMKSASLLFFGLALIAGYLSGYYTFFCVLFFNALYYIYSVPPTRFKRIPVLSAFIISLCCLSAVMAGFFTFSQAKTVSIFPPLLIGGIVGVFFLAQHVKDIKDLEGDRAEGIITIPTLLGPVWGSRAVALMTSVSYLIIPLFLSRPSLFLGAVPAAVISYWLITKKRYKEKYIFVVYFIFGAFLVCMYL